MATEGYAAGAETPMAPNAAIGVSDAPRSGSTKRLKLLVKGLDMDAIEINAEAHNTVADVKDLIQEQVGIVTGLQKLLIGRRILGDEMTMDECEIKDGTSLTLLQMEADPDAGLFTWDIAGNPNKEMLTGSNSDSVVTCPALRSDYVNVLTQKPIKSGSHYFQFIMHHIGDEQWCGVTRDASQAGRRVSGHSLKGFFYYCGRMNSFGSSQGALEWDGGGRVSAPKLAASGDVVGLFIDFSNGYIAFDLNGEVQGKSYCSLQPESSQDWQGMWILTHVDTPGDKVELRKLNVKDAPEESRVMPGNGVPTPPMPPKGF